MYLTRVWCIFEQFKAVELKIKITMILPPDQDEDLKAVLDRGKAGFAEIADNLFKINARTAQASVQQDADTVKNQIRSTVGFDAVNSSVKASMLDAVNTQLTTQIKEMIDDLGFSGPSNYR